MSLSLVAGLPELTARLLTVDAENGRMVKEDILQQPEEPVSPSYTIRLLHQNMPVLCITFLGLMSLGQSLLKIGCQKKLDFFPLGKADALRGNTHMAALLNKVAAGSACSEPCISPLLSSAASND